jgi:hypothetical protein
MRNETTAKNVFKENENGQLYKRQLPEGNRRGAQKGLGRTALLGSQIPLKGHRQTADRAKDF